MNCFSRSSSKVCQISLSTESVKEEENALLSVSISRLLSISCISVLLLKLYINDNFLRQCSRSYFCLSISCW